MATLPLKGGSNFSAVASRESLFLKKIALEPKTELGHYSLCVQDLGGKVRGKGEKSKRKSDWWQA